MYVHIGSDIVVRTGDIIGFFDLDNTSQSHRTRRFLNEAERAGRVESAGDDLPRSFVLTDVDGLSHVCLSVVSTTTLKRRAYRMTRRQGVLGSLE